MIQFEIEIPKDQSSIIKVIGVGGGGGNAVNYMYEQGVKGVDFIVCNTDSQALAQSSVPNKIQLGPNLTQGLGAGANPEVGKQAGEESIEEIKKLLEVRTKMVFITAGMGGGTGTGAAPIVAKTCKELGILTVGIVTTPFTAEGPKRMRQAREGIEGMKEYVDTILIVSNDKLRQQFGNLPFTKAFSKADDILATAARCITDLITDEGRVNLDFNDVRTVMKEGGVAILGSAEADGENRALDAVTEAMNSPLLNDNDISGAKWILLNITSANGDHELTLDEMSEIQIYVQEKAGENCDIIFGMGHDNDLGDKIAVAVIATGFEQKEIEAEKRRKEIEASKIVHSLGEETKPEADNKVEDKKEEYSLSPQLKEYEPIQGNVEEKNKTAFVPFVKIESAKEEASTTSDNDTEKSKSGIELVIKETNQEENTSSTPFDNQVQEPVHSGYSARRPLTEMEMEEERRFEEAKKALEDRAERLRNMSFNYNQKQAQEMEEVPAYQRRNIQLEEGRSSSEDYLSSYYIENKEDSNGNSNANVSTINTFLEGEKPD